MGVRGIYLGLVGTAVLWGGTFVAGRVLASEIPPFSAAFIRFAIATVALWTIAWRRGGPLPRLQRHQILPVFLLGLTGVFAYNWFFFSGLQTVPAGRASVIIANNPVAIAVGAAWFLGERLGRGGALGVLLSVCGAVVVISHGDLSELFSGQLGIGELLILGCVASWSAYSLIGRVALRSLSPFAAVLYACTIGGALLLGPALGEGLVGALPGYSVVAWVSLLYLGLGGSALAFVWYYRGIETLGAARAAVFINLVPVSGVVLAFLLLGEPIDASLVVGGALVATGITITNRTRHTPSRPDFTDPVAPG